MIKPLFMLLLDLAGADPAGDPVGDVDDDVAAVLAVDVPPVSGELCSCIPRPRHAAEPVSEHDLIDPDCPTHGQHLRAAFGGDW